MSFIDRIDDTRTNHAKQKGFMEAYDTEEGQQFKFMNMREDALCISDNDSINYCGRNQTMIDDNSKYREVCRTENSSQIKRTVDIDTSKSILSHQSIINHQMINKQQSLQSQIIDAIKQKNELENENGISIRMKTKGSIRNNSQFLITKQYDTQKEDEEDDEEELFNQFSSNQQPMKKAKTISYAQNMLDNTNVRLFFMIRRKIMHFLHNYTLIGRRFFLKQDSVHSTLNDKSDGYLENKEHNFFIQLFLQIIQQLNKKYHQSFFSRLPVMNQQSKIGLFLLILFIIFNSFFFLLFSITIVFRHALVEERTYLYKITLIVWVIELLRRLNTSTYQNSNVITERKKIFIAYFQKKALFDLIPILFLLILLWNYKTTEEQSDQSEKSIRITCQIICFIKLKNLMIDLEEMQKNLCMVMKNYYIMKLANLIVKLFVIGHIIACLWYIISEVETSYLGEETTWYNNSIASDKTWWKTYMLSMYWAMTLMTTGSNVATTALQTFFTSFIMLFTTIISGYMINATGLILCEIDASEENKRNDLNIINEYMREKNISMSLQRRVNIYLEYYYEKNYQKVNEDTKCVLSKISSDLTNLMHKEYFFQILSKIDFLQSNFSTQTLENLATQCEEVAFFPNQVIFQENDFQDSALLMIIDGSVEIYQTGYNGIDHKTICYLKSGQILGQINFFTGMARSASARSQGFTKIAKIRSSTFLQVVKDHPQDFQTFFSMKDKILLYENYELMNIKCTACKSFKHMQGSCSLVHFNKDLVKDKLKIEQNYKQDRKNNEKFGLKKHNTFKHLSTTFQRAVDYLEQLIEDNFSNYGDEDDDDDDQDDEEDNYDSNEDEDNSQNSHIPVSNQINENVGNNEELRTITELNEEDERRSRNTSYIEHPQSRQKIDEEQSPIPYFYKQDSFKSKISLSHNNQASLSSSTKDSLGQDLHQKSERKNKQSYITSNSDSQSLKQMRSKILKDESILTKSNNVRMRGSLGKVQISQDILFSNFEENPIKQHQKSNTSLNLPDYKNKKCNKKQQHTTTKYLNKQLSNSLDSKVKIQNNLLNGNVQLSQEEQERIMWYLDKIKDYDYYFSHGNSTFIINQFKRYQKIRDTQNTNLQKIKQAKKGAASKRGTIVNKIKSNQKSQPSQFQNL